MSTSFSTSISNPISNPNPNPKPNITPGAFLYGRTLTIKFNTLEGLKDDIFEEGMFPKEILSRLKFFAADVWQPLLKPFLGDPDPEEMMIAQEFSFIIITSTDYIPLELSTVMRVIKVTDKVIEKNTEGGEDQSNLMDEVAALYGATGKGER
jgi:hypothetical protein